MESLNGLLKVSRAGHESAAESHDRRCEQLLAPKASHHKYINYRLKEDLGIDAVKKKKKNTKMIGSR